MKVESNKVSLSAYLGILGMTGLTAYLGLTEIGKSQRRRNAHCVGSCGSGRKRGRTNR